MIEYKVDEKANSASLLMSGTGIEILNDVVFLINQIYESIKRKDGERVANAFRSRLTMMMLDPNSPMWKEMPVEKTVFDLSNIVRNGRESENA